MVIAVNARFLIEGKLEGIGYFTKEVLHALMDQHPEHEYHLIFDRDPGNELTSATTHVLSPAARHPVLWKFWFDLRLPRLLKKIRADVFLSPDGFCSLGTRVPQCLVVHDLAFLYYPAAYRRLHAWYYKRYTPKFLKKAGSVATVSQFSKEDIIRRYHLPPGRVDVIYNGMRPGFRPLTYQAQDAVKARYTGGKAYFLYLGSIHPRKNLVNLLKAFSVFKKRLQSEMKLVLAGRLAWKNEEFLKLLKTYKYKEDVVLTGYLEPEEVEGLTASAYAMVYPSLYEGFGLPVAEAMRCDVPVLTSARSAMEEVAGDAGLYFDPADFSDIADKMMMIYKDEGLRARLIENGRRRSLNYSWSRTADLLWSSLMKAGEAKS
jgi:glycosyltransferase involved in cell wall biosynthesis